ncbi:MAG: MoaD/ThiS family protein [Clostridiales bacterium]|jgi:adenylyltransferase/sulfurtransferase|nr:MoaD/ThiS family protein [Clostridiales bacterium]MDR2752601.1 MoaD/ThiS family protein [Clostridiales bacterium]
MATLLIPTALRAFAGGQPELDLDGSTAGEVIAALALKHPEIKEHLYEESGKLRSFINVYVGDENVKKLQGLDTPVKESDSVMLVPAIAGGRKWD